MLSMSGDFLHFMYAHNMPLYALFLYSKLNPPSQWCNGTNKGKSKIPTAEPGWVDAEGRWVRSRCVLSLSPSSLSSSSASSASSSSLTQLSSLTSYQYHHQKTESSEKSDPDLCSALRFPSAPTNMMMVTDMIFVKCFTPAQFPKYCNLPKKKCVNRDISGS